MDLLPGANYSLFLNLDSPLTGELTNLAASIPPTARAPMWSNCGTAAPGRVVRRQPAVFHQRRSGHLVETDDNDRFAAFSTRTTIASVRRSTSIRTRHLGGYYSNQLDIDQLSTGGYRLFLRHSKGRTGVVGGPSAQIGVPGGWPPGNLQMLTGPDNQTWLLYRLQYAVADTPAEITEFKNLEVPVTSEQRSHARNPQATVDAAGRVHLVWDHFALGLYYSRLDAKGIGPSRSRSPKRGNGSRVPNS